MKNHQSFYKLRILLPVTLVFLCVSVFHTCVSPPDFSETPVIEFSSVNKNFVTEQTDSVSLVFTFTDGDGDLGVDQSDTSFNTFITDVRNGKKDFVYPYRLPYVSSKGNVKDISGEITITLPGVTCIPGKTNDTITYKIQIKDRAGHLSNIIESTKIFVNCQ